MEGTKGWEKDHREEPLHRNEYWHGFLFEMFLNSLGLIFKLLRGMFSSL